MEPLLSAILDTVFASLAEAGGVSDWLRDRLGRDPEKLADEETPQASTGIFHA